MSDVFVSAPGTVAVVDLQNPALVGGISLGGPNGGGFNSSAVLISGADYGQKTDQQFQMSLDRALYLYVFGDSMGSLTLHGKAFFSLCKDEEGNLGFTALLEYYRDNRAAARLDPLDAVIGDLTVSGFLTEMKVRCNVLSEDPVGLVYDFEMTINALPENSP